MKKKYIKIIRRLHPDGLYYHKIKRMRDFDPEPEGGEVPDPYYGGMEGFRNVYKILYRSCENLFRKFEPRIQKEERDMRVRRPPLQRDQRGPAHLSPHRPETASISARHITGWRQPADLRKPASPKKNH